jgi:2-phosphosulfolactate phosphatase
MYAKKIIVAGFINADAVVEELKKHNGEIALVCAGWKTRISLEDQLCAGYIIRKLMQDVLPDNARDGARMAFVLSEKYENQISEIVHLSNHAMRLIELGYETDIAYCSQLNTTTVIPVLKEGTLINDNGQEKSNSLR